MNKLKKEVVKGFKWTLFNQLFQQAFGFIAGIILARLLLPEDFGLLGLVTVFIGFSTILVDFGFSSAIIHKKDLTLEDLSTIYWTNIIISIFLTILFFIGSYQIANFYGDHNLILITKVLSISFIISSISTMHGTLFVRNLDFKVVSLSSILSKIISSVMSVILALNNYGVWSLVIGTILGQIIATFFLILNSTWKPKFTFSFLSLKKFIRYSSYLTAESSTNYWARNFDNLIIGKMLGEFSLGIYSRAYNLMLLPISSIVNALRRVMFPALSRIQEDKEKSASVFFNLTKTIAFFTFPLMFWISAVSEPFIIGIYGNKWIAVIPILRILAILGAIQSINTLNGIIFNSQGKTDIAFKITIITTVILLPGFYLGIKMNGIIGLTIIYFIISTTTALVSHNIALHLIATSILNQFFNLKNIFLISGAMSILVFATYQAILINFHPILSLLILLLLGIGSYLIFYYILFRLELFQILKNVKLLIDT
jgi:PST family polysaccharide transporter